MGAAPSLAVVITVVSDTSEAVDTSHLERCLEALQRQADPPAMEVLVTCDARLRGVDQLRQRFPQGRCWEEQFINALQPLRLKPPADRQVPVEEGLAEIDAVVMRERAG